MVENSFNPITQEQQVALQSATKRTTIGLPACDITRDRSFPLTPEATAIFVNNGYVVNIENNASSAIHYTDKAYSNKGATITSRATTLASDIVVSLAPLSHVDISGMRQNSVLMTLSNAINENNVAPILKKRISTIFIDNYRDHHGNYPIADILAEIDGRAAMSVATSLLSNVRHGKGILIGGVTGLTPCETVVFGGGIAGEAAAKSALGMGALVRIFDNNTYRLRQAESALNGKLIVSFPHRQVILNALRTADIVIVTSNIVKIDSIDINTLKKGVVIIDVSDKVGTTFPSLPVDDLLSAQKKCDKEERICYFNAGKTVPRTIAMAVSSSIYPIFKRLDTGGEITNTISTESGIRGAVATFAGHITCRELAQKLGRSDVDINLFTNMS